MAELCATTRHAGASVLKNTSERSLIIFFSAMLMGQLACGSNTTDELACSQSKVYGGTAASADPRFGAVGYLRTTEKINDSEERGLCTATRIAQGKALTADHCISSDRDWNGWLGFALEVPPVEDSCGSAFNGEQRVIDVRRNPALDLAVLKFDDAGGDTIPLLEVLPRVGSEAIVIGYGVTETGSYGQRRFAKSVVTSVDTPTIAISSAGVSGACVGDSGSPLLFPSTDAGFEAGGFLSAGSADCHGTDLYTASAVALPWLSGLDGW